MDNFEFKKSLGQNFLKDENIINKIISFSSVDKETLVIEIGPGGGSLSKKLIPLVGYAILYEIDTRLRDYLNKLLASYSNYEIIFDDFLNQDLSSIRNKYNYKKIYVVANLPYYITTPIITKLMNELYPDRMILMVQSEVADRLTANCGSRNYGMITVLLGAKYDVYRAFNVSKKCFIPEPNVDSSIICFDKNDKLNSTTITNFELFIKDAFQFKRKNLRNNLCKYDLVKLENVLNKYGFSLKNRAEEISVELFINIFNDYNS